MRSFFLFVALLSSNGTIALANPSLLKMHCGACHGAADSEGNFELATLGKSVTDDNLEYWLNALDRVKTREMPPADESRLVDADRRNLLAYLRRQLDGFDRSREMLTSSRPRRMNNREFAKSVADVLMIEDVGTHLPIDNLIGDARHHGFDTHADTLGFSRFHLEQYIRSIRKIVDATILAGPRPESKRIVVASEQVLSETKSQNTKRPERRGRAEGFDFLDPKQLAYLEPFKHVPATGWYKIRIDVIGLDRGRYDAQDTGVYDGDPIQLRVEMGDRDYVFDLPDNQVERIELNEWMAEGSRLKFQNPTDGLRLVGNGNFKFQNRITASYFKKYEPHRYEELVKTFTLTRNGKKRDPDDWHNWVDYWMGPRPRLLQAVIEGPVYKTWPPARQVKLIGENPSISDVGAILDPIAERAWRRPVRKGELDNVIALVRKVQVELGTVEALKEGIVSILVSPQFLLLNTEELSDAQRFASKFSYLLRGTTPSEDLRKAVESERFDSHSSIVAELKKLIREGKADSFQREFPFAWLELNDINFMAPDPAKYHHYHRKLVSEDMVGEVLHFFRYATEENIRLPELLLADYSFVNADLAKVYGLENVPQDSNFRKFVFNDGRRGGLLGSGAFLTSTADSLFTSPIHRAIYVMENFLGIHPTPPPGDVEITEPDVRQAKTIKEILSAHRSDKTCLSCHQLIDPFGYAFENYGPDGSWRDVYTVEESVEKSLATPKGNRERPRRITIPIDASSEFLSGSSYRDISGFRSILSSKANQSRFVRCFVTKLLTYANGEEPKPGDFAEIDAILREAEKHDCRMVETLAAVIDSPLFRE